MNTYKLVEVNGWNEATQKEIKKQAKQALLAVQTMPKMQDGLEKMEHQIDEQTVEIKEHRIMSEIYHLFASGETLTPRQNRLYQIRKSELPEEFLKNLVVNHGFDSIEQLRESYSSESLQTMFDQRSHVEKASMYMRQVSHLMFERTRMESKYREGQKQLKQRQQKFNYSMSFLYHYSSVDKEMIPLDTYEDKNGKSTGELPKAFIEYKLIELGYQSLEEFYDYYDHDMSLDMIQEYGKTLYVPF